MVKQKEEEIVEVKQKKKNWHLISAVCFLITIACAVVGIVTSRSDTQLAVSCFWAALAAANTVAQFILYFKK